MAKFYARLVLLGSLSVIFLIVFLLAAIVPSRYKYNEMIEADPVGIRRGISSVKRQDSSQWNQEHSNASLHVPYQFRSSITLITDDKSTKQQWGWPITKQTLRECALVDFSKHQLPSVSVIVCFHNKEKVSNLLHTVHGVYQRTPAHLLKEVILIDDCSQNDDFGQTMELYVEAMFNRKIRIYRSPEKMGLIKARLHGIRMALAEVVVVMDSHVEVQKGWAEPLLHEIHKNPKTMAASYLDWMEKKGTVWEYRHGGTNWKSYFDWTFIFGWQSMSYAEIQARPSLTEPIRTPVIIGTIFAIRKDFFEDVGAFDSGMLLWGGENLDLPVRVWLCGGRVVNVPCSRAGHLESPGHRDYRLNSDFVNAKYSNYKRFAEVWTDDFKKYFYLYTPEAKHADAGDVGNRMELKSVCNRDFSWFLKEIFPELGVPDRDSYAWGPIHNLGTKTCLDTRMSLVPGLNPCDAGFSRQGTFWNKELHLRFPIHILNNKDLAMFGVADRGLYMDEYISHHNMSMGTEWFHWENGPIIDAKTVQCLEAHANNLVMRKCDLNSPQQRWRFEHYTEAYYNLLTGSVDGTPRAQELVKRLLTEYAQFLPNRTRRTTKSATGDVEAKMRNDIPHDVKLVESPKR